MNSCFISYFSLQTCDWGIVSFNMECVSEYNNLLFDSCFRIDDENIEWIVQNTSFHIPKVIANRIFESFNYGIIKLKDDKSKNTKNILNLAYGSIK